MHLFGKVGNSYTAFKTFTKSIDISFDTPGLKKDWTIKKGDDLSKYKMIPFNLK